MIKRIIYIIFGGLLFTSSMSCKNFLDVKPIDRLGDSEFWNSKSDLESAIASAYGHLFDVLTHGPYLPVTGDMRCGELVNASFTEFTAVGHNDLTFKEFPNNHEYYNLADLSDWYPFYQAIAECNIDIDRIPQVKGLSKKEIDQYIAEVRFVRDFTYFFICRLYGDVPLYTKPYDKTARARTSMIDVLQFCLDDLDEIKEVLPWQYQQQTKWGVRASRGSVYALIANINMWMAGFDKANQEKYWNHTANAVSALISSERFSLLPIDQFKKIFEGRSQESLFEFEVNANYELATIYVTIGEWTLHDPIVEGYASSDIFFNGAFMEKLFPRNEPDKRRDLWFYKPYANSTQAMFLKYSNLVNMNTTHSWRLNDNLMIFRYGGILLLGAEALAKLGKNQQAIKLIDEVRSRAGATHYSSSSGNLEEFIFWERQRELIGEGVRWYDFVRTGKVMDPTELANSLTPQQFNRGAWTWPISPKARVNNPKISLNPYWVNK